MMKNRCKHSNQTEKKTIRGVASAGRKTLVRLTTEYCSAVWDPHTQEHIHQLESMQKRVAPFFKKDYSRQSSIA